MTVRARCKHFTTERQSDEKVTLKYECWIMNYVAGLCIMSVTVDRLSHLWLIEFSWWNSCWEALERPQTNPEEKPVLLRVLRWRTESVKRKCVCWESFTWRTESVFQTPRDETRSCMCWETHALRFVRAGEFRFSYAISCFFNYYLQICKRNYPE